MYIDNDNKPWTVRDLIRELEKLNPDAPISIPVQTYTQRYPSGYFKLSWVEKAHDGTIRLWVHLGKGFIISERKDKNV